MMHQRAAGIWRYVQREGFLEISHPLQFIYSWKKSRMFFYHHFSGIIFPQKLLLMKSV